MVKTEGWDDEERAPLMMRRREGKRDGRRWRWSATYLVPARAVPFAGMDIPTDPGVARADHQRELREFLSAARAVSPERWNQAPDAAHWSPAQIAEHVRMTYEVVSVQFNGGAGIRVRSPWWLRPVLRWRFLPRILETGVFPRGAKAPREIRPSDGPFDRETVLNALEHAATATESLFVSRWNDPTCQMTHHVFGALNPSLGARLVTVHTQHHARQLRAFTKDARS